MGESQEPVKKALFKDEKCKMTPEGRYSGIREQEGCLDEARSRDLSHSDSKEG